MTILDTIKATDDRIKAIVAGNYSQAEDDALFNGTILAELKTAINDACANDETCGADLADILDSYEYVKYHILLQFTRR